MNNTVTMDNAQANVDPSEVSKFDQMAARWWDPEGEFRPLHDLNPTRLKYIQLHASISNQQVLDVGCGGGILSEAMAKAGAHVTGIDAASKALGIARLHAMEAGLSIDYQNTTAEVFAQSHQEQFDTVTCLELIEHVPDPASLLHACYQMVKPGGHVFVSTINRTPKAYALAVLGAEYIMRLLPKGTHDYDKFIKPSELASWARAIGLQLIDEAGLHYNPLLRTATLNKQVDVNYLMCFQKPVIQ